MYLPGDTVVHEGDAGKQLFFIGKGKVKVMSGDGSVLYAILKARGAPRSLAWPTVPQIQSSGTCNFQNAEDVFYSTSVHAWTAAA